MRVGNEEVELFFVAWQIAVLVIVLVIVLKLALKFGRWLQKP